MNWVSDCHAAWVFWIDNHKSVQLVLFKHDSEKLPDKEDQQTFQNCKVTVPQPSNTQASFEIQHTDNNLFVVMFSIIFCIIFAKIIVCSSNVEPDGKARTFQMRFQVFKHIF